MTNQDLHKIQMLELDLAQARATIRSLESQVAELKRQLANHDQLASMAKK